MSQWVKSAVETAARSLSAQGHSELATDLCRISDLITQSEIEALRYPQSESLITHIKRAESCHSLNQALFELRDSFGFSNATFHVVREGGNNYYASKVITTYPEDWINEYVGYDYSSVDPVMSECLTTDRNFFWSSTSSNDSMSKAFMKRSLEAGIGTEGYSFIVDLDSGDRFAVSVTSFLPDDEFARKIASVEFDMSVLARNFCSAFVQIATGGRDSIESLPPDFLRMLRAVATGTTAEELNAMEFSYGSARTVEKSILAMFKTRTLAEAAVISSKVGWLHSTPLVKNEIVGSRSADGEAGKRTPEQNV